MKKSEGTKEMPACESGGQICGRLTPGRIVIAGTGSGCGKTTVTSGLLQCLKNRRIRTAAFKCGPDYIDPMFHEAVLGVKSGNLDLFFSDEETLRWLAASGSEGCELSVIEGAMGYYDGIGMTEEASAWHVARTLRTPSILVVGAGGTAASLLAVLEGFLHHAEDKGEKNSGIRGVIFNRLPAKLYGRLAAQAEKLGIEPLGYLPADRRFALESRHLGLVTAQEISDLKEKINLVASCMEETVDVDGIIRIAAEAQVMKAEIPGRFRRLLKSARTGKSPRIAVARDRAFCFLYRDTLEILRMSGAEIVFFSPLHDRKLPHGTDGLFLCGGYPELYADQLEKNRSLREDVRRAAADGMPVIAECGGFLYLHERLESAVSAETDGETDGDAAGEKSVSAGRMYEMAGVLSGDGFRGTGLQRFGYVTLTAESDGLAAERGGLRRAHEFHYWKSTSEGADFTAEKADKSGRWKCGISTETMYAGFAHLSFCAEPETAERFVEKCRQYHEEKRKEEKTEDEKRKI